MRRALSRTALALAVLVAACSAETDDTALTGAMHAERARELKLVGAPPLRTQSREDFGADAQKRASERTEESIQRQHDAYGRLGFFPRTFDLRGGGAASSAYYVAYYSTETKSVTLVGTPDHSTLVHELVHALQDQAFDLSRLHGETTSSDESLARTALIEGDATMAELRDVVLDRKGDPIAVLREVVTVTQARNDAVESFKKAKLPLLFAAHSAFAYTFGAAFVADELFLSTKQWDYKRLNARFAAANGGPYSTQEVIRAGAPVDAIVETGLDALPTAIAADWVVESVDRMGEWYTYVLMFPVAAKALALADLTRTTAAWDGDQLLVLRKKDGTVPPSTSSPSGIVWTTVWDDEEAATRFTKLLSALHAIAPAPGEPSGAKISGNDGEPIWLEQRGLEVCFVKNLAPAMAAQLAHAALYTAQERRFEVLRTPMSKPAIIY